MNDSSQSQIQATIRKGDRKMRPGTGDNQPNRQKPQRVCLLHLHGLFRGQHLELGRDADTGGQTQYVLELAKTLAQVDPDVEVEVITRQIFDSHVSEDYRQPTEQVDERVQITRIAFGPDRYLAKEELWAHLDEFVERAKDHFLAEGTPDVLHGHYADAGQAGALLARHFNIPFVFTGHSLGRCKRRRLEGTEPEADLEQRYQFGKRIAAEEFALRRASRVVTSTQQEIDEQYALYEHGVPDKMQVIPPGINLDRFLDCEEVCGEESVVQDIEKFLRDPEKPVILAMSRPDTRKNISTLLKVYGESERLQQAANLVLILGVREDLQDLPAGCFEVMSDVLLAIDRYDLYGKVAYPKEHHSTDVPKIYRYAEQHNGVFANIALTEPFGLTLLEAGAAGLPVVATSDGGPIEILKNCDHGVCVDPLDEVEIETALFELIDDADRWEACSQFGKRGVQDHYTWKTHVRQYLAMLGELVDHAPGSPAMPPATDALASSVVAGEPLEVVVPAE